ncbi:uncharacterized protein LOC103313096 [Tribolium castaneum]|uniref:Uncharacterized protein n=1 Tax=Tribolium castaneum TaxID=7070 RepID=A0A139WGP7_TRICA|nr:PREDICTED: uncharacterized protein LOC103313096 [Tribolium castaneum]KYB27168.1 hypothetical protein TcasGA2_TC033119 [Tribolium castaneum]|eukprot:XP_008193683.1 PREDICTED: uncharacterized protein LOC103313096 [Tribolium castaneum]
MSELSEDEYDYRDYIAEFADEKVGPPLIAKKSRLIAAAVQGNVDIIRDLLDSPKWYHVRDNMNRNLLHIAILREQREVFDYILTLPDFPFDAFSTYGETVLDVALTVFGDNYGPRKFVEEYFARELLRKGIFYTWHENTLLLRAIERSYNEVVVLLIEQGVDVDAYNCNGFTPLQVATTYADNAEATAILLMFGADPLICYPTWYTVFEKCPNPEIQKILFYYIYDQGSEVDIHLEVLLPLAATNPSLFDEVFKNSININMTKCHAGICLEKLCVMDVESLKLVITKCTYYLRKVFSAPVQEKIKVCCNKWSLENLLVLLESNLRDDILNSIKILDSTSILQEMVKDNKTESEISEVLCFLLSYGLEIAAYDLHLIYSEFGYCNLFKILLHMDDVSQKCDNFQNVKIMPLFSYDVTISLEDYLDSFKSNQPAHFLELCSYFCRPNLIKNCDLETVQQIPLLVELARNEFRKFFVEKFQIKTCRRFYSLLNCLPISNTYKKIVTYETPLY